MRKTELEAHIPTGDEDARQWIAWIEVARKALRECGCCDAETVDDGLERLRAWLTRWHPCPACSECQHRHPPTPGQTKCLACESCRRRHMLGR